MKVEGFAKHRVKSQGGSVTFHQETMLVARTQTNITPKTKELLSRKVSFIVQARTHPIASRS